MLEKPLLRGHLHQAGFFIALGACAMLLFRCPDLHTLLIALIYSFGLLNLFAVSALYHRPQWSPEARLRMRRLDHSAIFILIASTGTPICALTLATSGGPRLLWIIWLAAGLGIFKSLFWSRGPKWPTALLAVLCGWLLIPEIAQIQRSLGTTSMILLILGGVLYTIGALVYAIKKPNPWPRVFGYHEVFHLLVLIAAACHFAVIAQVVNSL